MARRKNMKLSPRFYGPFMVVEKVGSVAYKLDLLVDSKIHSVFHVSCLKEKLGRRHQLVVTLPPTDREGVVRPEPEEVLERRMKKKKGRAVTELLIKWRGLGAEEASWEEYNFLVSNFPDLVDKVL